MNEERVMILRMLAEGKLTAEQAEGLIAAMEQSAPSGRVPPVPPTPPTPPTPPEPPSAPSLDALFDAQYKIGDAQTRLAELQGKLGSALQGDDGRVTLPFGLGSFNIGQVLDEVNKTITAVKVDTVRQAKQAARAARKDGHRFKIQARRSGIKLDAEVNFDTSDFFRNLDFDSDERQSESQTWHVACELDKPVVIANPLGRIRFVAGEGSSLGVTAVTSVWHETEEGRAEILSRVTVTGVDVPDSAKSNRIGVVYDERKPGDVNVDLEIALPFGVTVEAETLHGDIEGEDVPASLTKASSIAGSIRLRNWASPNVPGTSSFTTRSGSIDLKNHKAWNVKAISESGSVSLHAASLTGAELSTRSGDVSVLQSEIVGDVKMESSSGDVSAADSNFAGKLIAQSISGDVLLDKLALGSLDSSTSSGDVTGRALDVLENLRVRSVSGDIVLDGVPSVPVTADNVSGNVWVSFSQPIASMVSSKSISGDIDVKAPDGSSARIALVSQSGTMECTATGFVQASADAHRVEGALGEGQGTVTLHSVSGNVTVLRA
ncbi:MAG TPA: DUF4097 family beta strand repeat-containing protein [Capsulimonadaceae bacterium]|jgi:DUF4097 and DUF4098 domain-containing protein YvlB